MRHDRIGAVEETCSLIWRNKRGVFKPREVDGRAAVLKENVAHVARSRPCSDWCDKPIKRQLRANCDKNHTTAPAW
jgi:hypothetical protein